MSEGEHVAQRTETGDAVDPLLRAIGRQIKFLRERAGLTQAELGERIGYGVDLVSSVERGRRAPKPQFIDGAERVLDAGGLLRAVQDDLDRARYPARFREFATLEADAVEIHTYSNHVIPGLLQTDGYARAIYTMRRPALTEEKIEQQVEARLSRHAALDRQPPPVLSFVIEEVVLRRPLGGMPVLREQLRHLLRVGQLRHVEIQVMPTHREEHAGLVGAMTLLEPADQPRVAYTESQGRSTWFTEHCDVRIIDARYGIIRAQALTPRESLEFIEQLLGER
ncbi:helix-turn-helix domain-containing protein [Streptomyces bathyalis]|uniref:Helix-turn-helix domain-containing protein n=1 Tax=Streptomyces bathyalis TaxID=2710756 RepID=A0A7T1WRJ2_9ACTN|nr:helix-turn-helix transcriptional regulator [Streptomyces bathyalis]QPP06207.1 helix-turn-helix domain-containing protein [Streptomyces bathyalis]